MSLLDEIQSLVTEVFSDQELFFYPVIIKHFDSTSVNPWASNVEAAAVQSEALGLETQMSEKQREAIPDADTLVLVLYQSLQSDIQKGDIIYIPNRGQRVVVGLEIDPAYAVWEVFCRAPAGGS